MFKKIAAYLFVLFLALACYLMLSGYKPAYSKVTVLIWAFSTLIIASVLIFNKTSRNNLKQRRVVSNNISLVLIAPFMAASVSLVIAAGIANCFTLLFGEQYRGLAKVSQVRECGRYKKYPCYDLSSSDYEYRAVWISEDMAPLVGVGTSVIVYSVNSQLGYKVHRVIPFFNLVDTETKEPNVITEPIKN